ncbi:uncharacterized protein LOC118204385 isoform X2 [Stegodyphus dumicola]|uniref:uncharacterized protein LOC118204385 isoform X2 n=1 Tax=Stegodyphus dumicola TaxID=202533 RepID=UPI0015A82FE5|nr:uncharacterized protein LOC118204385 isoform X2 [Stegodyphus dumicola]
MIKVTMFKKLSSFFLCSLVYSMVSGHLDEGFDDMSEDDVSRCYYDIICRLGVEPHDEAYKCYLHAPHEDRYFQLFTQRFIDLMSDCTQDLITEYNEKYKCEQH